MLHTYVKQRGSDLLAVFLIIVFFVAFCVAVFGAICQGQDEQAAVDDAVREEAQAWDAK